MKPNNIYLTLALSALLLTSCEGKAQSENSKKTEQESNNIKKTYTLKGFKQSCCSGMVNYSLEEVNGFIKSEPNVKKQELTVWYDKTKCTEEEIKKAINKTPYKIIKQ